MKVGPKGQVVIPKVFRKSLGISPGSTVVFELRNNEILIEKPRKNIVRDFERIAKGGKSVKINPHEYEDELGERWKKSRGKK